MKKAISLLLALAMLFAFAACSAQEEPVTKPEPEAVEGLTPFLWVEL